MTRTRLGLLILLGSFACPPVASAQSYAEARKAVNITQIYSEAALQVGQPGTFRARIAPGAVPPIEYRWDFGDGGQGEGNGLMYRYDRPGRYRVVVQARNNYGRDRDTVYVVVTATGAPAVEPAETSEPEAAMVASADPAEGARVPAAPSAEADQAESPTPRAAPPDVLLLAPPRSGFTWVVGTFLHREAAEASVQQLRAAGYRSGLIVEDAPTSGSPAYRVVVGEYATSALALRAQARLPRSAVTPWLLELKKE